MLPKPKKTKRKFYNKWIYKVSCYLEGAYALRIWSLSDIVNVASGCSPTKNNYWSENNFEKFMNDSANWLKLGLVLGPNEDKLQTRIEGNSVDVYTNDKALYDTICDTFKDDNVLWRRFEPTKGTEKQLLDSEYSVFVKHLPHHRYLYKVYLLPHKLGNVNDRTRLCDWLETQKPKITFTDSIRKWVINTTENWDRRYIYVEDEPTLMMMKLREHQLIGKVYKHIIK